MNTPYSPESHGAAKAAPSVFGLHPLIAIAAAAVIAVCGVGIATMLMNRTDAVAPPQPVALASAPTAPASVSAPLEPPPPAQSSVAPEEAAPPPKPVASKPVARPAPKLAQKPAARTQIAAAPDSAPSAPVYYPRAPAPCRDCAVVESTREVRVAGEGSGLGAIAGGVVGGLLGNRVGEGRGRTAATVAGAVGGGFAGNAIERSTKAGMQYQLVVRFEDGTSQTFTRAEPWPFGSGDRVKVINGEVVRD